MGYLLGCVDAQKLVSHSFWPKKQRKKPKKPKGTVSEREGLGNRHCFRRARGAVIIEILLPNWLLNTNVSFPKGCGNYRNIIAELETHNIMSDTACGSHACRIGTCNSPFSNNP
jgi:hypothetical protein